VTPFVEMCPNPVAMHEPVDLLLYNSSKSSAVAEMGDRIATIDMGCGLLTQSALPAYLNPNRSWGAAVPSRRGSWVPI